MRLRWTAWLGCVVILVGTMAVSAQEPPPPTPRQQERLKERDRLREEANRLARSGKGEEAVVALEKIVALDREVFGTGSAQVAASLDLLVGFQERRGEFAAAARACQEMLTILTALHGENDWRGADARVQLAHLKRLEKMDADERSKLREADRLEQRVQQLYVQGKVRDALPLAETIRETRFRLLGQEHPSCASSLNNLAALYKALGERDKALPLFEQARDIHKRLLTERHPEYATSLNNLALLYRDMGAYDKALPLFVEALAILKKSLGENHRTYSTSLNNLALLYRDLGAYDKALPLFTEALALRKKLLTDNHPSYATSLSNLAALHRDMGAYDKALPLEEQARDLRKKLLTENHPDYATSLLSLGLLYRHMGAYAKALPLCQQARDLRKKLLTENHPAYALSLNNLAGLYQDMGAYDKALPLFEQARDLRKKLLTENHPEYASSLNNLAMLYQDMGAHDKALPLFEEARALRKQLLTENHPAYAASLNNLAALCREIGAFEQALPLFVEALALRKKLLTDNHPSYALGLNNLAALYRDMGACDKALPLYEQARDLRKKLLTENHPDYATSLNNLGVLYQDMGNPDKALPLLAEAGELRRKLLTEKHPAYASSLDNLAALYQDLGDTSKAQDHAGRALACSEEIFRTRFAVQTGRLRYQTLREYRDVLNRYLSVVSVEDLKTGKVGDYLLAWKGAVAAAQAEERLAQDEPALRRGLELLRLERAKLRALMDNPPTRPELQEDWLIRFREAESAKEKLETQLALDSAPFRAFPPPTASRVVEVLPPGTTLVDFLQYTHLTPNKTHPGRYDGEPRLLALVLRKGQEPVCVALGRSEPIDTSVAAWRKAVAAGHIPDEAGKELVRLIWDPLRKQLAGAKAILLGPDGSLCGFPFAALPAGKGGGYLLEEDLVLGYVPSARHLLLLAGQRSAPAGRGLLAAGDLDYGPPPQDGKPRWGPIPGTAMEIERLTASFRRHFPKEPEPRLLTGAAIAAERLGRELTPSKDSNRWRYLHLATHGFVETPAAKALPRRLEGPLTFEQWQRHYTYDRNPMLLSGLALSGANRSTEGGTIRAEEVASLDLRGVDLAVLSACQTGVGKVETGGQGVQSLQTAFQLAGARTLVVSLWNVHDPATSVLMEEFYTNLWQKKLGRLEALRDAQRTVLSHPERVEKRQLELRELFVNRKLDPKLLRGPAEVAEDLPEPKGPAAKRRSPPAWWAAFVLSGDAGPLR